MLRAGRAITRRVQLAFHTTDTVLALRLRAHYCGFPRFSPRAPFRVAPRARTPVHTTNDFFSFQQVLALSDYYVLHKYSVHQTNTNTKLQCRALTLKSIDPNVLISISN